MAGRKVQSCQDIKNRIKQSYDQTLFQNRLTQPGPAEGTFLNQYCSVCQLAWPVFLCFFYMPSMNLTLTAFTKMPAISTVFTAGVKD